MSNAVAMASHRTRTLPSSPILVVFAVLAVVAGMAPATRATAAIPPDARVVVAVIDSGPNPYHEAWHAGGPLHPDGEPTAVTPEVLEEFGIDDDHIITVTRTGDFAADWAADRHQYDDIADGEVYWFEGTNLLAVSFDDGDIPLIANNDDNDHGIGTTVAAATTNPEAIILAVDGLGVDEAEDFAFDLPGVDIVSTSYGEIGSPPGSAPLTASHRGVVGNGKLHVGAADNSPALATFDSTAGPWWTIAMSGYEEASRGRAVASGSLPDFLAAFTMEVPGCLECEEGGTMWASGTSISAPVAAGLISRVLLEARRAFGHTGGITVDGDGVPLLIDTEGLQLSNWQLRRVMEEAAAYPGPNDWHPQTDGSAPLLPRVAYAQSGWGVLTTEESMHVVGEALAILGVDGHTRRRQDKPADTCAAMTANLLARRAYWDNLPGSDSMGQDADPYVYCTLVG